MASMVEVKRLAVETIELEPDGEVLRIWLNRPESRNAHNQKMVEEVGDLFIKLKTKWMTSVTKSVSFASTPLNSMKGLEKK